MSRTAPKKVEMETIIREPSTKREAAHHISKGHRHVVSSKTHDHDPSYRVIQAWLNGSPLDRFPWEVGKATKKLSIDSSKNRYKFIQKILQESFGKKKLSLRQKIEGVLEELVTNAIYHAYRKRDGSEKYSRNKDVALNKHEEITVYFRPEANGVFLSVTDQGGSLRFSEIANTFYRCYGAVPQIEAKEGGAGLGMYMIFESVTHLKIESSPGKSTTVSCWISDSKSPDANIFSFNFFEKD